MEHSQSSAYLKSCHLHEGGISRSDEITSCFYAKVESKTQLNLNPFILLAIQTTRKLTPQRSQILIRSLEKGLQVEGENWEESLSSSPPCPSVILEETAIKELNVLKLGSSGQVYQHLQRTITNCI